MSPFEALLIWIGLTIGAALYGWRSDNWPMFFHSAWDYAVAILACLLIEWLSRQRIA